MNRVILFYLFLTETIIIRSWWINPIIYNTDVLFYNFEKRKNELLFKIYSNLNFTSKYKSNNNGMIETFVTHRFEHDYYKYKLDFYRGFDKFYPTSNYKCIYATDIFEKEEEDEEIMLFEEEYDEEEEVVEINKGEGQEQESQEVRRLRIAVRKQQQQQADRSRETRAHGHFGVWRSKHELRCSALDHRIAAELGELDSERK